MKHLKYSFYWNFIKKLNWHYFTESGINSTMTSLIDQIHTQLTAHSAPKHRDQLIWFFKNQRVNPIGVRSREMNKLVVRFWRDIKKWEKIQIWKLCDGLWQTGILEDGHLACKFAHRVGKQLEAADFFVFNNWLHNTIYNWAHCDDLCTKALGEVLHRFPTTREETANWHSSNNRWVRRGLAVSMLPSLKNSTCLDHCLDIADRLLMDQDDLVQKGYGWMLKVASQQFPEAVYAFILDRRDRMPRTALRYAIEKLPTDWRHQAMKKA